MTQTIKLETPDGDEIEVDVDVDFSRSDNPADKDRAHYSGEDDGWCVEEISLA